MNTRSVTRKLHNVGATYRAPTAREYSKWRDWPAHGMHERPVYHPKFGLAAEYNGRLFASLGGGEDEGYREITPDTQVVRVDPRLGSAPSSPAQLRKIESSVPVPALAATADSSKGAASIPVSRSAAATSTVPTVNVPQAVAILQISDKCHPILPGITTIGRHPNSMIHLSNANVSKHHAEIEATPVDGRILLRDLNSCNGTKLRGDKLHSKIEYPLKYGDSLSFGPVSAEFNVYIRPRNPNACSTPPHDPTPIAYKLVMSNRPCSSEEMEPEQRTTKNLSSVGKWPDERIQAEREDSIEEELTLPFSAAQQSGRRKSARVPKSTSSKRKEFLYESEDPRAYSGETHRESSSKLIMARKVKKGSKKTCVETAVQTKAHTTNEQSSRKSMRENNDAKLLKGVDSSQAKKQTRPNDSSSKSTSTDPNSESDSSSSNSASSESNSESDNSSSDSEPPVLNSNLNKRVERSLKLTQNAGTAHRRRMSDCEASNKVYRTLPMIRRGSLLDEIWSEESEESKENEESKESETSEESDESSESGKDEEEDDENEDGDEDEDDEDRDENESKDEDEEGDDGKNVESGKNSSERNEIVYPETIRRTESGAVKLCKKYGVNERTKIPDNGKKELKAELFDKKFQKTGSEDLQENIRKLAYWQSLPMIQAPSEII